MSLLKKTPLFCVAECSTFLDQLRHERSRESQIAASLYFRKKLAACQEPPYELIEPIICELIDCLQRPSSELQLNAAWALTNLACGSRQETHRIIASGGVSALMRLLAASVVSEVRNQAVWALGNLAADCSVCREQVRSTGLLELLVEMLELPEYQDSDARKIVIWCLANLLRGGINQLDLECVSRLISALHSTISLSVNGEILCDSVWSIAYLMDHAAADGERIDLLLAQPGIVVSIVALLKSDSVRALTGALRTVGNIITGTDEQTTAILDFGVLNDLKVLVDSDIHQVSRECLWILSNVAAGTAEHVTRLFSVEGLSDSVFRLCQDPSPRKRKEAYWVMVNAMMGAPAPLYDHLLSGGLAQILVLLLRENLDAALLDRTLNTIRAALEDRSPSRQYTIALFRRVGLVEQLLKVARGTMDSVNNSVHHALMNTFLEQASSILRQHFGISVDDGSQSNKKSSRDVSIQVRIKRS
uniref:Importin subunit alpha n=1 Tax=Globodera pallida TaxID=36090 RepID=A0A183BJJ3_GLOPA